MEDFFATLRVQLILRFELSMFDYVSLPQTHVHKVGWIIFFRQLACTKYHDFIICDEGTAEGCLRSRFQGKKKESCNYFNFEK